MTEAESHPAPHRAQLSLTDRELFERLGWFTEIRWAFGVFTLLVLLVSWHVLGVRFIVNRHETSIEPALYVALGIFLYNALFTWLIHIVRGRGRPSHKVIVMLGGGQLAFDALATLAIVHFTGGVENFFVVLIVLPIAIATSVLPRHVALAIAGGAAILFNALAWGELAGWIPHVQIEFVHRQLEGYTISLYSKPLYVLQVTTAMTVTMLVLVFITSAIVRRLRARESELERAYEQLEQVDEAKGFFMRKAGHEMRAPLAAIHSILGMIAEDADSLSLDDQRRLARAQYRAAGLISMVNDLRRYSRLRSADELLSRKSVRLGGIVSATGELFGKQAEEAGVRLTCRARALWVQGDEEALNELATNLVANALQYTPRGGRVDVELNSDGEFARLTVADTGIGISEKARAHLFEEFYRAPEAKRVFMEGTGLGLAICKRIVEMHAGRIEAQSRPEGGTVFVVLLPLDPQPPGQ